MTLKEKIKIVLAKSKQAEDELNQLLELTKRQTSFCIRDHKIEELPFNSKIRHLELLLKIEEGLNQEVPLL